MSNSNSFRTREERLRELERERALYMSSHSNNNNNTSGEGVSTGYASGGRGGGGGGGIGKSAVNAPVNSGSPVRQSGRPDYEDTTGWNQQLGQRSNNNNNYTLSSSPMSGSSSVKYQSLIPATNPNSTNTGKASYPQIIPTTSSAHALGAAQRAQNQPFPTSQSIQFAASPGQLDDSASSEAQTSDICFATESMALRSKIRMSRDGKQSFVDEIEGLPPSLQSSPSRQPPAPALSQNAKSQLWEEVDTKERLTRASSVNRATGGSSGLAQAGGSMQNPTKSQTVFASTIASAAKEAPKKRSNSADPWKQLVSKEGKNRGKFHTTDKTLFNMLEEERSRFLQLESEYNNLLADVEALQTSHMQEIRGLERKSESELRSLQKQLLAKSEELAQSQRDLANIQQKYTRESHGWVATNERLESQLERMTLAMREAHARHEAQEKLLAELRMSKKEVSDRSAEKDVENKSLKEILKEREGELAREKEAKVKLEVQSIQLDHFITQRDEEIRKLRAQLQRKTQEVDDLSRVKSELADTKEDLGQSVSRERSLAEDLQAAESRERALLTDLDEATSLQRKTAAELDRSMAREAMRNKDLEHQRATEAQLREELNEAHSRTLKQTDQISALEGEIRRLHQDGVKVAHDFSEMKQVAQDLRKQCAILQQDLTIVRAERDEFRTECGSLQNEFGVLHAQYGEVSRRLEAEIQAKSEVKQQNKERLISVAEKIGDMQASLTDTQQQLEELRRAEENLRSTVRNRDETIAAQHHRIGELEAALTDARSLLAKEEVVVEAMRQKKQEDMLNVQEKFAIAKAAFEQELQILRQQLAQKSSISTSATDENGRLKIQVSELSADKFRLEAKVSELSAAESSLSRQIASLQQQMRQKDQEAAVLTVKLQTLTDQVPRLTQELEHQRTVNLQKEQELTRIQNNVSDMNKRLRAQVDNLLDRESSSTNVFASISSSVPASSLGQTGSTNYSPRSIVTERTPSMVSLSRASQPQRNTSTAADFDDINLDFDFGSWNNSAGKKWGGLGSSVGAAGGGVSSSSGAVFQPPVSSGKSTDRFIAGLDDIDGDFVPRALNKTNSRSNLQSMGNAAAGSGNTFLARPADQFLATSALSGGSR